MPLSDKSQPLYDKENHDETSGGHIHQPSEKWWQLECAHKHLHQLASIGSENEGMQDGDNDEQGMVDEDNDKNLSGDTLFSSHSVPTTTPHISATAMEALQALMSSDCDMDDEFYSSPSASFEVESMKQKKSKDKCMAANMHEPDAVKNTSKW
ncbi:hypothetical protein EDC04DRAFT_2905351 [Pisolithus marmoratus]|nr:hypothetical protein EDC04DRAFT_2905351 [Pisolithus marmoratus]